MILPIHSNQFQFSTCSSLSPAQVVIVPGSSSVSSLVPSDTGSLGSSELPPHVGGPVVGAQVVIMPGVRVSSFLDVNTFLSLDGSGVTPLHADVSSVGMLAEVVVPPGGLGRLGRFNDLGAPPSP